MSSLSLVSDTSLSTRGAALLSDCRVDIRGCCDRLDDTPGDCLGVLEASSDVEGATGEFEEVGFLRGRCAVDPVMTIALSPFDLTNVDGRKWSQETEYEEPCTNAVLDVFVERRGVMGLKAMSRGYDV